MIRWLQAIALMSAVGTSVANAASLQLLEAWQNETPLPSSTGQITTDAECAHIVTYNLSIAPDFGYTVDLHAETFSDPESGIKIKQSCVPAEPFYEIPLHPFAGRAPPISPVACPAVDGGTDIWFIYGQSGADNSSRGRYTAAGSTYAYAGNGQCYPLSDPIVGTTGSDAGPWTRLADKFVGQMGLNGIPVKSIVVINRAVGSSSIEQWAAGGDLNDHLASSLQDAISHGFTPTRIFQHQGEVNAREVAWVDFNAVSSSYQKAFASVLRTIRNLGIVAPIYVATATICNYRDANNPSPRGALWRGPDEYVWKEIGRLAIRDAQRSVVTGVNIKAGANTDLIDWRKRAAGDGCHLGEAGLAEHAQLWYDALTAPLR
jgi:hypothetical protein